MQETGPDRLDRLDSPRSLYWEVTSGARHLGRFANKTSYPVLVHSGARMREQELDHFWKAGRAALRGAARARAEVEGRADQPPRPGDLLLFAETAALGVLWVVVETDAVGSCLLAAADANPLIGSRDLSIPAGAACGALTVRRGLTVRCAPKQVALARRVGALEPKIVDRLSASRTALENHDSSDPLFEGQVDEDPEYRDWVRRLVEAREVLSARADSPS